MTTRRFLIFYNPISGNGRSERIAARVYQRLRGRGFVAQLSFTRKDGVYTQERNIIMSEKVTDIVIVGGDGTVSQVVSSLRDLRVTFGIIPSGSGNGLAFGAGIPKSVEGAIDILLQGKEVAIDAFLVNGRFACMLFGVGFDGVVAHRFARQNKRGFWTYFKSTILALRSAKPYSFVVSTEDHEMAIQAYFISVANSNQYGNQVRVAPYASLGDGLLDIVANTATSKSKFIASMLIHLMLGRMKVHLVRRNILYTQRRSITILNPEGAPIHIDGEYAGVAQEIKLEIIPEAFRLWV